MWESNEARSEKNSRFEICVDEPKRIYRRPGTGRQEGGGGGDEAKPVR
jgi:hypothetical protein